MSEDARVRVCPGDASCGHRGLGHGGILFGFKGQETLCISPASLKGSLLCAVPLKPLNVDSGDSQCVLEDTVTTSMCLIM